MNTYCTQCGAQLQDDARFCPACGTERPNIAHHSVKTHEPDKKYLEGFSWGYFSLGLFWLVSMEFGVGYLLLYLVLFFSTTIASIVLPGFQYFVGVGVLVINVILAFSVREAAWQSRKWKSFEDFKECQGKWDSAAKTLLGVGARPGSRSHGFRVFGIQCKP